MVPHGWSILREENIPKLFFDLYDDCWRDPHGARVDCARLCLSALVYISALRRSFFGKENERTKFITQLIEGTTNIIRNKIGLEHDGCYHELCRLLGKVNSASQLSELCTAPAFIEWTDKLFQFTMESLENWRRLPNSKHYLLGVWIHMMSPLQFLKGKAPVTLDNYIAQITMAFILSRIRSAEAAALDRDDADFENPLSNEVLRSEQLEAISELGRCRYPETASKVMDLFQETRLCMQNNVISEAVFQEKITWLVYIIGALIGGHASGKIPISSGDEKTPSDLINGKLASQVFELIQETNKFPLTPEPLELAYLYFLEQFRKVYIGEHARQIVENDHTDGLFKVLGVEEGDAVLDLVIQKIGFNLQNRVQIESVIKRTLYLFQELASGINIVHCSNRSPHLIISGKLMLKNATVKYILANHSNDQFGFRTLPRYGKYRTSFYFTLAKLLFMDIRDDKEKFEAFMQPMAILFDQLWQQAQGGKNIQGLRSEECRMPIIGLVRDLRGISLACNSFDPYFLLFSWLVNKPKVSGESRIHLFTWAADVWWDDADVCIALLKFLSEFVHNKAQRITFEQFSAYGILLFKEVSSTLMTYGTRILERTQFRQIYREKYKGLATALEMFSHVLSGNYVVFGVFEVYGDLALSNSLKLCLEMCLAIPQDDLQAYLKSLKPFYSFLDLATKNFIADVMNLSTASLAQLIQAVEDGLCSFETNVSMQCCSIVDNVVTHFCNKKDSPEADGQAIRNFLESAPQVMRRILQLMFQLVITGEHSSPWSMSRPLLGLILLYENEFILIQRQLASQHLEEKQLQLEQYFTELMRGVEANVSSKNKEVFTRNLYQFAQSVRTYLV
ncbi:importin-beta N-terminal domain-containing protein [Cardiosporidium cionae]|uniref:Importin-beta N-terminal domain-containing protein n=1 Tax=Cardiosporidium cionae TaxID=476202 RepID=A0ABQ7J4F9_9APIC|nr:importin-beta N-terminal domain-containing protein [Cardiosporidium cionae]|eukprot:KAF8817967.1 importin-beta N-terminal domain-containing protein [Cardiosporidium cionae]